MRPVPELQKRRQQSVVRILLVEDDDSFADLVREELACITWGEVSLERSATLDDALEQLSADGVDLVITDLDLPDSQGLDTLDSLASTTDRLIIVLTGHSDDALKELAISHGAYALVNKDELDRVELERLVRLASMQASTFLSLRQSEARFRNLVQLSSDWYWEMDAQMRYTLLRGVGLFDAESELLGKSRFDLPGVDFGAPVWDEYNKAVTARRPFRDIVYARTLASGKRHYVSISGEPIFGSQATFLGYRGIAKDVTEAVRQQEELRRFRLAMDSSADMIVLIDRAAMRFVDVNATVCRLLGYTRDEMLSLGPQDLLPVTRQDLERSYDALIAEPATVGTLNSHYRCKDGSKLPFESTRHVIHSGDKWLIAAISRDTRERFRAENALRNSEERFRALTELSSDFYWESDAEHRLTEGSGRPEHQAILNAAQVGKCRWETPSTYPDAAGWAAHRSVMEAHLPFREFEVARLDADGVERYRSLSGEPVFDEQGVFKGYRGVGTDITQRKQEQRLLELEHNVTRCLADADSAHAGLKAAMRALCETHGWLIGRYWRVDPQARVLRFDVTWAVSPEEAEQSIAESSGVVFEPGAGLCGCAWQTGKPLWVADTTDDPRVKGLPLSRSGMRGAFVFPVTSEGKTLGILAFCSRSIREPQPRLLQAVRVIGAQIGQFLQRKRGEEEARQHGQRLTQIITLQAQLAEEKLDVRGMSDLLVERTREIIGDGAAAIQFLDGDRFVYYAATEGARHLVGVRTDLEGNFSGAVVKAGKAIICHDTQSDPRIDPVAAQRARAGALIGAPLQHEGRVTGVLKLLSPRPYAFDAHQLHMLELLAGIAGSAIQRARSASALSESEARFRALTELSSDMYWEQDDQYRFTSVSGHVPEHLKTRRVRQLGMRRWDSDYFNMSEADWKAHRQDLEARRPFRNLELGRLNDEGDKVWISVSGAPVFDAAGLFKGYRGVGTDITARKREEALVSLEHSVSRNLAQATTVAEALQLVMRTICETLSWECGRYFRSDDAGVFRFTESWHAPSEELERFVAYSVDKAFPKGTGIVGRAGAGEPIWVADVGHDARVVSAPMATEHGVRGAFMFPVMAEDRSLGVLSFTSREIREPDERLLRAVRSIGSQVGQFIQRKQAEEVRRESEERFRSLTGMSSDWYWEQDENFRFTLISTSAKDTTGRGPLSNIGKTRWDLPALNMTEADWAAHRALLNARQPFYDLELFRRTAEGKSKYTSISGEPMFDAAGLFKGYRGIGRDITGRKRAEQLVMLEHTVTRALAEADSAPAALEAAIRSVCETEGWECGRYFRPGDKADALRLGAAWGVAIPEIEHYIAASRDVVYTSGAGLVGEVWQTGQPVWVADLHQVARTAEAALAHRSGIHGAFVFPVMSEARTIGVLAFNSREVRQPEERLLQAIHVIGSQVGQFIQRKQAEEVRRESEERFRSLTKLSSDFYWETDAEHRTMQTHYAGQHEAVIPRAQRFGKTRWETPSTYPDAAGWAAHRATLEAHLPFRDFELARIDDHGVERYISISGEPMFDAERRFKGYRGVGKDITPRKQAEERQARHTRYQEKIARFGASALGKRQASALIEDALQNVVEALPRTVVIYVEPGSGERELVMRGCVGLTASNPAVVARYGNTEAVARALQQGEVAILDRPVSGEALLPFDWAAAFRGAALVPVHGDNRVLGAICVLSESQGAFGAEESKFLVTAASVLSAGLRRIESEGRLAFLAQFDALTGLPNRALLSDRFSQLIVQAGRHATPLGVLFIDLDDFKLVNDSLGHAGGDELLKEAAQRLQAAVRPGDTVARISGDEFAVILSDLARPDDAALVAQKIIDRLAKPMQVRGHEVFVTASIGIAAFPADGDHAEALLGAADAAMYRAKQSGRNGYQFFTADINQRTRARVQLGSELRRAIEREEFTLVYQPKYDLRTGQPCAAEALLRWKHPERGLVSPAEFIPVLEETGLIVAVGEWVLQRACKDLRAWQAEGAVVVPIAVNLSARQFRQQDLDLRLIGLIEAAGVETRLIELEITESQLMLDPQHATRVMRSLSNAGIRIAIDDFGTGYSSLSYLTRFPVAALKIDRSFVASVLSDKADAAIVRTIIDMAHTLGAIVIAEGVETAEQAALLRRLGCEQAQGYYFARPMPEAELKAALAASIDACSLATRIAAR